MRKMLKSKKASHVGFILSFVIFITAVVFLYTILQPNFQVSTEKKNVLTHLTGEIEKNVTAKLTTISLSSSGSFTEECFEFENLLSNLDLNNRIIVKNTSGSSLTAYTSSFGNSLVVDRGGDNTINFFKVLESEEFSPINDVGSSCSNNKSFSESEYTLGLVKTEGFVFSSKVSELKITYDGSYQTLKSELSVPDSSDFIFNFTYQNGTDISAGNLPESVQTQLSVYSEEKEIQYINSNGDKETGTLTVMVY